MCAKRVVSGGLVDDRAVVYELILFHRAQVQFIIVQEVEIHRRDRHYYGCDHVENALDRIVLDTMAYALFLEEKRAPIKHDGQSIECDRHENVAAYLHECVSEKCVEFASDRVVASYVDAERLF